MPGEGFEAMSGGDSLLSRHWLRVMSRALTIARCDNAGNDKFISLWLQGFGKIPFITSLVWW